MSGLDLSMTSLKREPGDFDDEDDVESNAGSEDSNLSTGSLNHGEMKVEPKETPVTNQGRSSRRKPAAPQWVNPDWQDEKEKQTTGDEVIINGVCVMQTEDYGRRNSEETVRVDPTPVMDRFEDDQSDASSVSHENETNNEQHEEKESSERNEEEANEAGDGEKVVKQENEEERWDY